MNRIQYKIKLSPVKIALPFASQISKLQMIILYRLIIQGRLQHDLQYPRMSVIWLPHNQFRSKVTTQNPTQPRSGLSNSCHGLRPCYTIWPCHITYSVLPARSVLSILSCPFCSRYPFSAQCFLYTACGQASAQPSLTRT